MAGAELIGREELAEIQELFNKEKVNLYRYGGGNYKAREFEEKFAAWMGVKYTHAVAFG
jgi:dTDP-4-amino-4,6-dideoxygalactose transaminase